jgi:hypothetical protein
MYYYTIAFRIYNTQLSSLCHCEAVFFRRSHPPAGVETDNMKALHHPVYLG